MVLELGKIGDAGAAFDGHDDVDGRGDVGDQAQLTAGTLPGVSASPVVGGDQDLIGGGAELDAALGRLRDVAVGDDATSHMRVPWWRHARIADDSGRIGHEAVVADLHIVAVGGERLLHHLGHGAPRTGLTGAAEHRPMGVDADAGQLRRDCGCGRRRLGAPMTWPG